MGVEGRTKCIKYMLFILNFLFWICGAAMVGLGVWILIDYDSFTIVMDNPFLNSAVYLLICVGAIVTIIAFLGCCGAVQEHKGCLTGYTMMLLLMLLGEFAIVGLVYYFGSDKVEAVIVDAANATFVEYGNKLYITDSWDTVQVLSGCCGLYGYNDYEYTAWADTHTEEFPDSCCTVESIETGTYVNTTICHEKNSEYFYAEGCVTYLKAFIKDNIYNVGGAVIGIAVLQLLGLICGTWLCCAVKKD
ncbi:tetraspanin-18-like [Saccoglossus kowalevskii]|uniref:Tetraspanin n=1 Tax=Saccoglossus kowalevskii TaxID=10224 RepID=A0ABM0GIT2_SACKO|nr:PREDICTED: tetraspanin-18-like [Saccoglossus kowalevskii]